MLSSLVFFIPWKDNFPNDSVFLKTLSASTQQLYTRKIDSLSDKTSARLVLTTEGVAWKIKGKDFTWGLAFSNDVLECLLVGSCSVDRGLVIFFV